MGDGVAVPQLSRFVDENGSLVKRYMNYEMSVLNIEQEKNKGKMEIDRLQRCENLAFRQGKCSGL